MEDIKENLDELDGSEEVSEDSSSSKVEFTCPTCGGVARDDVLFLCNTCEKGDLVEMEGIYMCPSCLKPGDNFECLSCGSTKVEMKVTE